MAEKKKFFSNAPKQGPAKPVYRHTWNRDDEEELPSESGNIGFHGSQSSTARVSPEKRKQGVSQEKKIFKTKVSRMAITKNPSEEKMDEDEGCTQIRCAKQEKEYYTVVKNVKDANKCHRSGQAQEMTADIDYLLSTVVDSENHRVKCLSVINIATKCQSAQFRAHLRAHGSSSKLFAALADASALPSLAISTACVIYLLARDRLGLVVDQSTLAVITDLITLSSKDTRAIGPNSLTSMITENDEEYEAYHKRVWKILNDWRQQTEAAAAEQLANSQSRSNDNESAPASMMFDITLDNLSARFLAIEALTFICCRTHDDSFRKWIRESRGLHQIAEYLTEETEAMLSLDENGDNYAVLALERLKMLERYLRILEHSSFMNVQNQNYLVFWEGSSLITTCAKLFQYFKAMLDQINIDDWNTSALIRRLPMKSVMTVLTAILKTLLNFSHNNVLCCQKLGEHDHFINDCLDFVTSTIPERIQSQDRFDLLVLSLGLFINLVELCNANRRLAIACGARNGEKAVTAFVKVFLFHDAAARETDDAVEKEIENSQELHQRNGAGEATSAEVQQSVTAALKKASKHMEDSIVASHIALFLGLILQQNENVVDELRNTMPDGKLEPLVAMLQKFLDFMRLTVSLASSTFTDATLRRKFQKAVGRTGEKTIGKAIEAFERLG